MYKDNIKRFLGMAIGAILGSILILFITLIFTLGLRYIMIIASYV